MGKSKADFRCDATTLLLVLSWSFGLFVGSWALQYARQPFFSLMRFAIVGRVSIVGLLISALLPFLFIAFAVYISSPKLVYLVCFLKTFFFMFSAFSVLQIYGAAGWLVHVFFRFSGLCTLPILWWFAVRLTSGGRLRNVIVFCVAAVVALCLLDYYVVNPFLGSLIEF